MEAFHEDSGGIFWFISLAGTTVTRAIGKNGLRAYKRVETFSGESEAQAFYENKRQNILANGFEEKSGKPEFNMDSLLDWSNLVKDYTRFMVHPETGEFWFAETRRDPTHTLLGIGRGVVGQTGITLGTNYGANNGETIAEIERLSALQVANGYIEEPVPAELQEWIMYGALLSSIGDPRAPKPFTLEEALKRPEKREAGANASVRTVQPKVKPESPRPAQPDKNQLREMGKALTADYKEFHESSPMPDVLPEWPVCLRLLFPFEGTLKTELPEAVTDAIESHGDKEHRSLPIRIDAILGSCPLWCYVRCPNLPEHHFPDFYITEETTEAEFREMQGRFGFPYHWSDITLIDSKKKEWPLRLVYNTGDADTNDGYWGAAWNRETREKVIDISSTGDIETTIEVSRAFANEWSEHKSWLPVEFDEETYDFLLISGVTYKRKHELEKLLHLAMIMVDDHYA